MLYRILLFLHVLGAILWFGGGVLFQLRTERATISYERARVASLIDDGNFLGKAYFGPVTLLVLVTGVSLVFVGDWGFDRLFVLGGLTGFLSSAVIGFALIEPTTKRLSDEFAAATSKSSGGSGGDAGVTSALKRLRKIGRVDTIIMLTVVFLMTVKPGL